MPQIRDTQEIPLIMRIDLGRLLETLDPPAKVLTGGQITKTAKYHRIFCLSGAESPPSRAAGRFTHREFPVWSRRASVL